MYQDRAELYETPIGDAPVNLFGTLTREYTRLNGDPDYMIKLISTSSIMVVHISGIVVEATWRGTYMNVNIGAPGSLLGSGRLRGIYGNFDGNAGNDFFNRATPQIPVTGGTNSAAVQAALQSCELHSDLYVYAQARFKVFNITMYQFLTSLFVQGLSHLVKVCSVIKQWVEESAK